MKRGRTTRPQTMPGPAAVPGRLQGNLSRRRSASRLPPWRAVWLLAIACVLPLMLAVGTAAQAPDDPTNAVVAPVTPEAIQVKIDALEGSTALDERTKARLLDLYTRTRAAQDAISKHDAAAEQYMRAREDAPEETRTIREEMEKGAFQSAAPDGSVTNGASLADLEAMLAKAQADEAAVATQLGETRQALAAEANRPAQARERLAQVRQRLDAIQKELKAAAPAGESAAVREAQAELLQSETLALNAEARMLDEELLSQPMRIGLLEARRDRDEQRLRTLGERVDRLEERVSGQRVAEAEKIRQVTEQAQRQAEGRHPKVQELAARNAALADEIAETTRDLDRVIADAEAAKDRSARVLELFHNTRQKLEVAGLSEVLGRIMLEQRRRLADTDDLRRRSKETTQDVAQAGLRQIQHEEERQQLRDPAAYLVEFDEVPASEASPALEQELLALVKSRQALVTRALDLDQDYLRALGELDFAQRALLDAATEYQAYLDERLLWVRSTPGPKPDMLALIPSQLAALVSPANWSEVVRTLARRAKASPVPALAVLLLVLGLAARGTVRRRLAATGRYIRKPSRDRFAFTLWAVALTLLMAAPWPLFLYLVGWELGAALSPSDFVGAVSLALRLIAGQFFMFAAFRTACVTGGLADAHFGWPEESLVRLRRGLGRFMWVFLSTGFITHLALLLDAATMGGGLGWLGFLVMAAALAAFAVRLLQPRAGVLHPYMEKYPNGLVARFHRIWLTLAVALPLALAVLATLGYRYTVIVLIARLIDTMYLVAGILLLHQLILRWLVLSRRRLAVQAAIARRRAAYAEETTRAGEQPAPPGDGPAREAVPEPVVDLAALGEETRQLLFYFVFAVAVIGIWMIWSKVLPAFGYLDQVKLWDRDGMVDGEVARVPVTVADALLAVIIGITTVVVTKRLPALLEIVLLQRLRVTPGARYAAKTLSSYAIILVGALISLNFIGITWSQLQWLVAALSVGIGFGLQEIVANFISGLIILFERPIRVGDVVTVGDTDGVVTRIQIRATTIRNWERKELLVPNKEFITSRLLNWSLSDQTTRIFISVGLAYGGDVTRAMALMAAAAEGHERILDDPAPFVCFEGFGDNALILNLRCYTDNLDHRLQTTSELHQAINATFKEAGLVIAFPQRDVHLDTSSPLEVRIQPGAAEPAGKDSEIGPSRL